MRLVVALLILLAAGAARAQGTAVLLAVEGPIGPAVAEYVAGGIATAGRSGARLVILQIDTPGGLDRSMRAINAAILGAAVPVACWVAPAGARAASAGTFILYACHVAAMAPGTHLGAATPVSIGGGTDEAMTAKAVNDAVATIRSLAELRGRNADWGEKAVRDGATLTAPEAVKANVADFLARDHVALLAGLDGRTVTVAGQAVTLDAANLSVEPLAPDLRTRALATLASPEVAYLLLLLGIYGILFEMMNPGTLVAGVIGAVSLLLGLYALNLLPVDYSGLGLVILGLALMVAEAFLPSFGILGLGGAIAFALGSLMMFDTAVPGFGLSLSVVIGATLASAMLLVIGLAAALRSRRGVPTSGGEALIGARAVVVTWRDGAGQVRVVGELWNARAPSTFMPGETVRVVGRDGLILEVEAQA